jgi:hypothetical protein
MDGCTEVKSKMLERPTQRSAAECFAHAGELERRAREATEAWAREQCLFSAGLWRSLAKEAQARETAVPLRSAAD